MQQQVQMNRLEQDCFLHDDIRPTTYGETRLTDLKVNFQHTSLLLLCNTTRSLSPLITSGGARGQAEPARLLYDSPWISERRIGDASFRVPLTFLWLSSLSTDKPLEDTLFSAFFRGLGCFVNNRWGSMPGQNG